MNTEQLFFDMIGYYAGDPEQIQHFVKVHSFALRIGLSEHLDADTFNVLEIAAIVHDIGIKEAIKKHGSSAGKYQEAEGPAVAKEMLEKLNFPKAVIDRVCYLVGRHHTYSNIDGLDYQILVEADFLVNMYEGCMNHDDIITVRDKIFRTTAGIQLCNAMYHLEV